MPRIWQPDWRDRLAQVRAAEQQAEISFVPAAATSLTVTAVTGTSVTLTWVSGGDGGANIIRWEVRRRVAPGAWGAWTAIPDSGENTTTATVSGLTASTGYQFQVRAVNANGVGLSSPIAAAVTTGVPSAPVSVSVTAQSATSLLVSWAAGLDGGSTVTSWQYRIGSAAAVTVPNSDATTTSLTLTGLNPNTAYSVQVRAVNANGNGDWSTAVSGTTDAGLPEAPTGVSVTNRTGTTLTVGWTTATAPAGFPVTSYQYRLDGGTPVAVPSSDATTTTATISGLTLGTTYSIQIRAVNANGAGAWSAAVSGTTLATASEPRSFTATMGYQTAVLSWSPPSSGAAPTSYEYRYRGAAAAWGSWTDVGLSLSVTVAGLSGGTSYEFAVRAKSGTITGATAVTSGTTSNVPAQSTITAVTDSDTDSGTLTVAWTAGSDGGSPVTGWQYRLNGGNTVIISGATAITTSTVITGLAAGTTYSVQVRAVNANGDAAWSAAVSGTTSDVPDTPTGVSVEFDPDDDTALEVSWTAAGDGGSPILRYEYRLNGGTPIQVTSSSLTITGLTPGTSYTVEVRVVNAIGNSGWSDPVATSTSDVPDAPAITSVAPSTTDSGTLTVAWTAGSDGDSTILRYEYRLNNGNAVAVPSSDATTTSVTLTGLTAGTTYSVQVRAVNSNGDGAWSNTVTATTTDVPNAPTITSVTNSASISTQLVVEWTAGAANGSPITGYEYRLDGGTAIAIAGSGSAITGLTAGTAYSVQIRAVNAIGNSPWSDAVSETTTDVPAAPTNVQAVLDPNDDTALTVTWAAGADGGSPITGWQYRLNGGTATAIASSGSQITGLTAGTSYMVEIRAVNAIGNSPWSDAATAITSTTPSAPTITAVTDSDTDSTQLTVTWTAGSDGGSPITGYEYRLDGGTAIAIAGSGSAITGLTAGTTYSVQIRAVNANGNGDWSTAVSGTTSDVPDTPTGVAVVDSDTDSTVLTVTWTAVSDGGSPILRYEYRLGSGTATAIASSGSQITGLTAGTSYMVEIRAVNAIGNSPWSAAVSATTSAVPGTPTITSVADSDTDSTQLTVTWTAAGDGGSPITGWQYRLNGGTEVAVSGAATRTTTITGLTAGTSYSVQIRAVNATGFSPWSAAVSGTTSDVPDAPATATISNLATTSLTLNWTAGSDGGSPILRYEYRYRIATAAWGAWTSAALALTVDVTGLTAGADYQFAVRAVNGIGNSTARTVATSTNAALPNAPTGFSVTETGLTSLRVEWTAPTYTGGTALLGYQIRSRAAGGTFGSWGTLAATALSAQNSGLTQGTTYEIELRAFNEAGPSTTVTTTGTTEHLPAAPTITSVTDSDTDSTQLTVTWTAGSAGSNPVTGWQYSVTGGAPVDVSDPAATSVTITGLTAGTAYLIQVRAVTVDGQSPWSAATGGVTSTTPSAPTITSVTDSDSDSTQLTVTWTAGSDGGSPVTSWQYRLNGGTATAIAGSGSAITGLTAGTSYSVQVRAVNAIGNSPWSAAVSGTTTDVPAAPTDVTVNEGTDSTSLVVSWLAGADGGSPITGWQYRVDSGTVVDATGSPVTITGLTAGTSYTVEVRAVNAIGNSGWGSGSGSTGSTVPDPPTGVTATDIGLRTVTVNWVAPVDDGGADVAGYQLRVDGGTWVTVGPNSRSSTNSSLTPNTSYTIEVRAYNINGPSTAVSVTFTTLALPSAPTSLTATPRLTTAKLSWAAPSSGATPDGYQVRYRPAAESWSDWAATTALEAGLVSLTAGGSYEFEVRAYVGTDTGPMVAVSFTTIAHLWSPLNFEFDNSDATVSVLTEEDGNGHVVYEIAFARNARRYGRAVARLAATVQVVIVGEGGGGGTAVSIGGGGGGGGAGELKAVEVTLSTSTGSFSRLQAFLDNFSDGVTYTGFNQGGGAVAVRSREGNNGRRGASDATAVTAAAGGQVAGSSALPGPYAANGADQIGDDGAVAFYGGPGGGGHLNWQPPGLTDRYGVAGAGGDAEQTVSGSVVEATNGEPGGPARILVRWKPGGTADAWTIPAYTAT